VTENQQEIPEESGFHPNNFEPVVLIQLTRLYDVGMALLAAVDVEKAKGLALLHSRGDFATPPPAFKEEEE
jgi:hypothetical protein